MKTQIKIYLLLGLLIIMVVGCMKNRATETINQPNPKNWIKGIPVDTVQGVYSSQYVIIYQYEIDGCQYIGSLNGTNHDFLTHKGNCINPIHEKTNYKTFFKND